MTLCRLEAPGKERTICSDPIRKEQKPHRLPLGSALGQPLPSKETEEGLSFGEHMLLTQCFGAVQIPSRELAIGTNSCPQGKIHSTPA